MTKMISAIEGIQTKMAKNYTNMRKIAKATNLDLLTAMNALEGISRKK